MHESSYQLMGSLLERFVTSPKGKTVVDIGASIEHGGESYRRICEPLGMLYTGADIVCEGNVNIVLPESFWPIGPYDVVISGQCLEHVRRPWIWMLDVYRVTKPGGLVFIIAPWSWEVHKAPIDCWRILPDGMESLLDFSGFKCLEVGIPEGTLDCYGVGQRPERPTL